MKKLKNAIFVIIFLSFGAIFFAWNYKIPLIQQLISNNLNDAPVYLDELKITKNAITFEDFFIGNFSNTKTGISLGSKKISIKANLGKITDKLFVIDSLTLKDTLIAIEYYNESGSENNWKTILKNLKSKWSIKKNYLIKKISLEKLTVQVTDYKGKVINYPIIDKLEFYNINSSHEFPINRLDKAVLNIILRAISTRLGLDNLLKQTNDRKVIAPHFTISDKKTREITPRADIP